MAKLIILRGNSGSGKTTVARELQRRFGRNTLIISQDVVRREMLWVKDGADTKALPLLESLLVYGRQNCDVTILEGILYADYYAPLFERALAEFGPDILAWYFDLPFEETLRRHETKSVRFDFGEAEMRRWWREKDYIGFLPEKTITIEQSLADTVDMIFQMVSEGRTDSNVI